MQASQASGEADSGHARSTAEEDVADTAEVPSAAGSDEAAYISTAATKRAAMAAPVNA